MPSQPATAATPASPALSDVGGSIGMLEICNTGLKNIPKPFREGIHRRQGACKPRRMKVGIVLKGSFAKKASLTHHVATLPHCLCIQKRAQASLQQAQLANHIGGIYRLRRHRQQNLVPTDQLHCMLRSVVQVNVRPGRTGTPCRSCSESYRR